MTYTPITTEQARKLADPNAGRGIWDLQDCIKSLCDRLDTATALREADGRIIVALEAERDTATAALQGMTQERDAALAQLEKTISEPSTGYEVAASWRDKHNAMQALLAAVQKERDEIIDKYASVAVKYDALVDRFIATTSGTPTQPKAIRLPTRLPLGAVSAAMYEHNVGYNTALDAVAAMAKEQGMEVEWEGEAK